MRPLSVLPTHRYRQKTWQQVHETYGPPVRAPGKRAVRQHGDVFTYTHRVCLWKNVMSLSGDYSALSGAIA